MEIDLHIVRADIKRLDFAPLYGDPSVSAVEPITWLAHALSLPLASSATSVKTAARHGDAANEYNAHKIRR